MVLKRVLPGIGIVCTGIVCAALLSLIWSSPSRADQYRPDQYRPDQFLGMDLNKAALSPKPLGPLTTFVPVPLEAKADHAGALARVEPKTTSAIVIPKTRVAVRRAEPSRGAARAKLARRHSNPLDAEAFDTRIQVWPCKSGGICNWKR